MTAAGAMTAPDVGVASGVSALGAGTVNTDVWTSPDLVDTKSRRV